MQQIKHTLYKIYYDCGLVYVGRTNQKLNDRLRGHFFKTPMMRNIDIEAVTFIESAELLTESNMVLYEVYYICRLKPPLNGVGMARDDLTVDLPPLNFKPYDCKLMDKWKAQITERDREHSRLSAEQRKIAETKRALRNQRRDGSITEVEYWERLEALKTPAATDKKVDSGGAE